MFGRKLIPRFGIVTYKCTLLANVTSKPHILKNISSAHYSQEPKSDVRRNPFKTTLEAEKKYHWCFCGHSKKVPFCDGSHKDESLKTTKRPIKFVVEETKPYALCNCQRSKKAPFCDGTHKKPAPETPTT